MVLLVLIYVFYTVPLTLASQLVNPESLSNIFPNATAFAEEKGIHITLLLSGLITALIWSGFFALCPVLFLSISNFGSMATSVANAEFKALQYYWWFMVVTAFSGQLLATMGLEVVNQGLSLQTELQSVLRQIAETIPSTTSVSWLNWIIFRVTITLPLNYLLQANSFLLYAFGLNCCSRLNRGTSFNLND